MSKSGTSNVKDLLYYSESYDEDVDEDIWDDRKLNDAYDKALRIANAEVAKRVAMSTNTQHKNKEGNNDTKKEKTFNKTNPKNSKKHTNSQWKAGMPCRAVYEVDGREYEAFVLRIINENECIVRFLGYENSEIVSISTLKPSLGKEERNRQIEQALEDKTDEAYTSQSPNTEKMDCTSDRALSPGSTEKSFSKNNKSSKKKKKQTSRTLNGFDLPGMPFTMPNISALRNLGCMEMPLPPPPMLGGAGAAGAGAGAGEGEEQALSSMLLSWYMSGYYTGLYQGLKRSKDNRSNI